MTNRPKPTLSELLNLRRYDPTKEPPHDTVIMQVGGRKVGSLQNLVTFTGKQKNGKSRYIAAAVAAGLTGAELFSISMKTPKGRPRVALFDTEQGEYDFYRQITQVRQFCGLSRIPATFDAFNTREDDPAVILKMMDHYLATTPECSILIVDGILDLLMDFNNVLESKRLINHLKRITKHYNILLIGVLHRGKGNDMTIGNIGSMADRLAQSVLKVEKTELNTFRLSSDFMRSDADFDPVEICNNNGHWEQTFATPETDAKTPVRSIQPRPADYELGEHMAKIPAIFMGADFLSYKQLTQEIKEVYGTGRNWAVECITHLQQEGLIYKTPEGYTHRKQTKIRL